MPDWTPIFQRTWEISPQDTPFTEIACFEVLPGTGRLRFYGQSIFSSERVSVSDHFYTSYLEGSAWASGKPELLRDSFERAFHEQIHCSPEFLILDPNDQFRGRWDPSFTGTRILSDSFASEGFLPGPVIPGSWSLRIQRADGIPVGFRFRIAIEGGEGVTPESASPEPYIFEESPFHEVNLSWYVGELHEHTSHSKGSKTPEETIQAYEKVGYHFLALTDHGFPPLSRLSSQPNLTLIRGQEMEWPFGHALLLGTHEWFPSHLEERIESIRDFIHDVHVQGGLFAVVHPYSLHSLVKDFTWTSSFSDWASIDLLEIVSGTWEQRFPESEKSFRLWNRLLNQGDRIYGFYGKGSTQPAEEKILEASMKTIVLSEGASETQLLSALKQGHFYATKEPAISLRLDSEQGGAFMGDELRLPVQNFYILYVDITQLERAFLRIITNNGIFCEMPISSVKDTHLKFYGQAITKVQWYRLEVYRYGRPLDDLLAFTNPVFVRGLLSV